MNDENEQNELNYQLEVNIYKENTQALILLSGWAEGDIV